VTAVNSKVHTPRLPRALAVRLATGALAVAGALVVTSAAAARPSSTKAPAPDVKPPLPPANVTLSVDAPTTRGPWTMRVTNEGEVPVTLVADARLLSLEVTPRGARAAERCELPADMRPRDDLGRPIVLPPKRTYAERFEPRLYCLENRKLDALAAGSIVVARLGWAGKSTRPPLEVAPIEGMEAEIAPSKSITSAPIALPDEPTPAAIAKEPVEGRPAPRVETVLSLAAPRSVDAGSEDEIALTVTLQNKGHRAAIVRFRPETLAFEVLGPRGVRHCGWSANVSAPTPDLFSSLAAGATESLAVMLSAYCPSGVFDQAGFYVVRATLDTRKASGAEVGLRTFDGQVIAHAPTLVRLHHGVQPEPLVRPRLQPPSVEPSPAEAQAPEAPETPEPSSPPLAPPEAPR
jgi:hypothetical protein